MKTINAQPQLRSRYVASYPKYTGCVNCLMGYVHGPDHKLAGKEARSKYPYCMKCLKKNAEDPDFVKWVKKLFGV